MRDHDDWSGVHLVFAGTSFSDANSCPFEAQQHAFRVMESLEGFNDMNEFILEELRAADPEGLEEEPITTPDFTLSL